MTSRGIRRRVAVAVSIGAASLALAALAAAASVVVVFARTVVIPPQKRNEDVRILDIGDRSITLAATADSVTPGRYSLWFDQDAGHARVGEILEVSDRSVTRELIGVDVGELSTARSGRFSGWFYLTPVELGFPVDEVEIETTLGPAPAWLFPAERTSSAWVIQVHGRAVLRNEALRAVPVFRRAGYNSLLISYRNDSEAPRSSDYRYGLGDPEWLDVESAMRFALDRGATDIVLMGWSMGGAIVLQAATRSPLSSAVRGIVLESPVVDWVTTLQFQGALKRIPEPLRHAVIATVGSEWGTAITGQAEPIDFDRLDFVARANELEHPILLLHSVDDGFVPITASRALAIARPDIVTFEPFTIATHTRLWNYDVERWYATIAKWLAKLQGVSGTP